MPSPNNPALPCGGTGFFHGIAGTIELRDG
jgi:hypothetical protein